MDRRELLQTAGSIAGLAAFSAVVRAADAAAPPAAGKPKIRFTDDELAGADGNFEIEKAKDAIEALCKYHGYPIFPGFRDGLWISDYGCNQFTKVGLAAYSFVNNVEDRYMMMDIFLLPGQMLPEHWHVPSEGNPAKLEGWLVRWGVSHIVGIGEPNLTPEVAVPQAHWNGQVTTRHDTKATPGMFVKLAQVESRHWQFAGPEGAIVTEVANVHTNSGVRHSDPKMNAYFLKQ
jgi:D-lyxose ketol-isomerase